MEFISRRNKRSKRRDWNVKKTFPWICSSFITIIHRNISTDTIFELNILEMWSTLWCCFQPATYINIYVVLRKYFFRIHYHKFPLVRNGLWTTTKWSYGCCLSNYISLFLFQLWSPFFQSDFMRGPCIINLNDFLTSEIPNLYKLNSNY